MDAKKIASIRSKIRVYIVTPSKIPYGDFAGAVGYRVAAFEPRQACIRAKKRGIDVKRFIGTRLYSTLLADWQVIEEGKALTHRNIYYF